MVAPTPLLRQLGELVQESGRQAQAIRGQVRPELKKDGTIVTIADRTVEEFLRRELPSLVRGSTVWGEEYGHEPEGPAGLWAVDPVDGTSNFAFGSPLWGVSVALAKGDEVLLGAVYLPDLGEMYLAEKGGGAYCNGSPLPSIPPGEIRDEELVSYSDYLIRDFPDVVFPGRMRCSGAFVIDGCFVAQQRYRGLLGIRERLYDIAACMLFSQELGGEVRYADGTRFSIQEIGTDRIAKPWVIFPSACSFRMC